MIGISLLAASIFMSCLTVTLAAMTGESSGSLDEERHYELEVSTTYGAPGEPSRLFSRIQLSLKCLG
jgi:hypothetical protein